MSHPDSTSPQPDREAIIQLLADTIEISHERIESVDADSHEEQELQIKWIRALGYLTGQYRKLLRDENRETSHEDVDLQWAARGSEDESDKPETLAGAIRRAAKKEEEEKD